MTTEANDTVETPAAQPAQQPTTDGANSGSQNSAKLIPQEQANEIAGKARQEGRQSAIADLLKKSGATSLEDLLSRAAKAAELEQAQMTEAQKAQAIAEKALKERDEALQRLTQREATFRQKELARAVEKAATAAKANDAETVYLYLKEKHGEALNAVMGEDGEVDTKTLDALLEKVKQEKAVYFTAPTQALGSISNLGGRPALSSTTEAMKRASAMNQRIIRGR